VSKDVKNSRRFSLLKYLSVSILVSTAIGLIIAIVSPETRGEIVLWLLWFAAVGLIFGVIEFLLMRKIGRGKR